MTNTPTTPNSVFATLRALMPPRALEPHEAAGIAERQAFKLLGLLDQHQPAVNVAVIAELPRIEVRVEPRLPMSGFSQWSNGRWLIGINRDDAPVRRRYTFMHELKHCLDDVFIEGAYLDRKGRPSGKLAEDVCDYFAASFLMPRPWVKQAWASGVQDQRALAQLFGVSEAAMALRLRQLGITAARPRWSPLTNDGDAGVGRYFRRGALPIPLVPASVTSPLLVGSRS